MTINGTNVSAYGATLLGKQLTDHEVVQVYDWLDGATQPVYARSEQRFRELSLTFLIEGATETLTESYFAALMLQLKSCILKFDELAKYFAGHYEGTTEPEKINPKTWLVKVKVRCHKTYLPEVTETASGVTSKSITNTGTVPGECHITVTPTVAIAEFTITGLTGSPLKIRNLSANKAHVIDGYLFRYLRDGANDIADFDSFAWPVLPVGTTAVTFSHSTATVQIRYYPRFS